MLSLDLSKVLPPQPYLYFSAFLPGLFFEFTILIANPDLARQLVLRSQLGFEIGHFLPLFIGTFFAFVVGNTLMVFTSLVQYAMGLVYRTGLFLMARLRKEILLPTLTRLTHRWVKTPASTANPTPAPTPKIPPRWVTALYVRTLNRIQNVPDPESTAAYEWWDHFVRQLLVKRYGMPEDKLPAVSFGPLQIVLTKLTPEDIRGSVLMNATQATGWAALVALRFAPALRSHWFIALALFLVGSGLLHDFFVAAQLNNPDWGDIQRLRAILREFPKSPPESSGQKP